ncbi:MAG TPA: hypothetical protein VF590_01295, partial [Isosphaeraceae bacterium]
PIEGLQLNKEQLIELDARLLQEARAIARPDERSLALARVARSKILDGDFPAAETALVEAGRAALAVPPGLIRDLRLMTVVRRNAEDRGGFVGLAEALSTQGRAEDNIRDPDAPLSPEFLETWTRALRAAQMAWDQAADLAVQIGRRPYRAEALYQVVESQAIDLTQRGALLDASEAQGEELREEAAPARLREAAALIDAGLRRSAEHARRIDLVQWRDRALAAVVSGAAGSRRFELGLEIARSIPQPEARADALLRLAEAEARHGSPAGTTRAYTEALRSIASIPVADLRAILTGVMVDSLISSGRYDDARAATVLYPDSPRRRAALGAVAEAMGRRGLTDSANAWIARENPPELRAELHRRLNDGILTSLEQFRTRELSINPVP